MFFALRAAVAVGLGLLFAAHPADAQPFEALGRIHLSFSPDEIVRSTHVEAFEPFDVYVLVEFDPPVTRAIQNVESGLRFHPSIAFNEVDPLGADQYVMVGLEPGLVQLAFGWSACLLPDPGLTPVLRLRAILQEDASDVLIGIEAVEGGSFFGLGPGWRDCADFPVLFEGDPETWATLHINQTVATQFHRWGTVKAMFGKEAP